jgi:hypothetical protein
MTWTRERAEEKSKGTIMPKAWHEEFERKRKIAESGMCPNGLSDEHHYTFGGIWPICFCHHSGLVDRK